MGCAQISLFNSLVMGLGSLLIQSTCGWIWRRPIIDCISTSAVEVPQEYVEFGSIQSLQTAVRAVYACLALSQDYLRWVSGSVKSVVSDPEHLQTILINQLFYTDKNRNETFFFFSTCITWHKGIQSVNES